MGTVMVVREGKRGRKFMLKYLSVAERKHSGNTEAAAVKQTNRISQNRKAKSYRRKELRIKCPYNRATNGKENKGVCM